MGFAGLDRYPRRALPIVAPRALERGERAEPPPATRLSLPAPTPQAANRRLAAGAVHVYPLTVKAGHLLELIVHQDGVDLQASVKSPGGTEDFTVDSPNGSQGPERVLLAAKEATAYRIEVSGGEPGKAGSYRIWIEEDRPATEPDWQEAEAEKLFHQARKATATGDGLSPEAKLTEASRLWEQTHNLGRQADALRRLGRLYQKRWEWQSALEALMEAKSLYRRAGRFSDEGKVANDIGSIYQQRSDLKAARKSFEEAATLAQRHRDLYVAATAYYNIGMLARGQARSGDVLENLERARVTWNALQAPHEIDALTAIGVVFLDAGEVDLAVTKFRESLKLADRRNDPARKSLALQQMANAVRRRDPEQARRLYQQVLGIQQQLGDLDSMAATLNGIGLVLLNQRRYQSALEPFQSALRIYDRKESPLDQARVLTNLGWTYAGLQREADALAAYEGALTRARGKDTWTEAAARLGLARLEERRGNPIAALSQAEAAVRAIEDLRAAVSPELRMSFFAGRQDAYDALIEILLWQHELHPAAGYDARALTVSEQARSRGLLDRISPFREPALAESGVPASRLLSLAELQREVLDVDTLLLEFHLGEKASYLWLVGQRFYRVFKLPPRERLERLITTANRSLVTSSRREKWKEAQQAVADLARVLLGPAVPWLDRKRLLISAPEALQGVPFAVLPADPDSLRDSESWPKPLIVEHEIVKVPSISVLRALRIRQANRTPPRHLLAILADPVFEASDERLAGVASVKPFPETGLAFLWGRFKRLAHAREEAEAILVEAGLHGGVMAAFDFDADRALVLSGKLRNYRILHFATHGWLQTEDADLSALVLSQVDSLGRPKDGVLWAPDISGLDLPADLVVLSACETGLGERIPGEGLVGLPHAFLAAGATRLLVSLWRVDDLASSELMKRFYHEHLGRGRSPAVALREAQKAMWQSRRYSAPFYWGAFEILGEWRAAESPR